MLERIEIVDATENSHLGGHRSPTDHRSIIDECWKPATLRQKATSRSALLRSAQSSTAKFGIARRRGSGQKRPEVRMGERGPDAGTENVPNQRPQWRQ